MYTGQTTQGLGRLEAHKAKKELWNKAVMFLDDDNGIDRDVLVSLETKTIDYVRKHGSYGADNSAAPSPRLSPYKEPHASILFCMRALGYDLGRVEAMPTTAPRSFTPKKSGHYDKDTGRFTVLAGSMVELSRPVLKNQGAIAARSQLFGEASDCIELADDVEFASPSAAAVFVLGGSQNGWTEWANDAGQTLDYVYSTYTLVAVWRCLRQCPVSSVSQESILPVSPSRDGNLGPLAGLGPWDRSSIDRYFRTIGSETPRSRAIAAVDWPHRALLRISSILSTSITPSCLSPLSI